MKNIVRYQMEFNSYKKCLFYFHCGLYFPVRKREQHSKSLHSQKIIKFKNGDKSVHSYFTEIIKRIINKMINGYFPRESLSSFIIISIPSSKQRYNSERLESFFKILNNEVDIETSFDEYYREKDCESNKFDKNRERLKNCKFRNKINLRDKNIIIFDDILTTGESFRKLSKQLFLEKKVKSVTGVFLGKTF